MIRAPRAARPKAFAIVADDYGLAPGVNRAIRQLISAGKLDGTGCMTLFQDWRADAVELRSLCATRASEMGLHLTLTDFDPLSGRNAFGERRRMPSVDALIKASYQGKINYSAVEAELDAQFTAFVESIGGPPAYIDGHQHVHFLPAVRRWLAKRVPQFAGYGSLPWLRGAPSVMAAPGLRIKVKTAVVATIALGFERAVRRHGYSVHGPLLGFYDWSRPNAFEPMLRATLAKGFQGVFMCHPGFVDAVLRQRDGFLEARDLEYSVLNNLDISSGQIEATRRQDAS